MAMVMVVDLADLHGSYLAIYQLTLWLMTRGREGERENGGRERGSDLPAAMIGGRSHLASSYPR